MSYELLIKKRNEQPSSSLALNSTACQINCTAINGHMPYLYEVDSVFDKIFVNGSLNEIDYPIFMEDNSWQARHLLSTIKENPRIFSFFISSKYDYRTAIWYSGDIEIKDNHWAKANEDEMKFPILNNRLLLMRDDRHLSDADHFGAINCDNEHSRSFKVKLCKNKFRLGR